MLILFTFSACFNDLDVSPLDPNANTPEQIYRDPANVEKGLLKIYSVWAISGLDGAGSSDLVGLDPGNSQLLRSWWNMQVVSTDECKNAWGDAWVSEMNGILWSDAPNESIEGVYHRAMYIVALANEFLLRTTDISPEAKPAQVRAEARYCRALAYYTLMDTYGRPPFITEDNFSLQPSQISREELFNWIVNELNQIRESLPAAKTGQYGRADQGAVDALLARIYLNAEVYIGKNMYTECLAACKRVIDGGYSIVPNYADLFKADNGIVARNEIIFPIVFSGAATETYGGTTYLIFSSRATSDVVTERDGVNGGWGGNRSTQNLVNKFEFSNPNAKTADNILDKRGIFYSTDRSMNITTTPIGTFLQEGWSVFKFKNITSTGELGSSLAWPDTDFPMFRLADIYLMYAEAVVRGGQGGDINTALGYVNQLRARGYGDNNHAITSSQLTKEFILDERSRELYWEGTRRTDLIRYGLFTSSDYVWPMKGGVITGVGVDPTRNLYPIPISDLSVNSSLTQNPGY